MLSTSAIKVINHHLFKPLYFSRSSSSSLQPLDLSPATATRFLSPLHSRLFSSLQFGSFMEVVRAVAKQGSGGREGVAIRTEQKNYTYKELVSSALRISSMLLDTKLSSDLALSKSKNGAKCGHLGGARIGIVAKPSAEFVAGMLGTWLSGGVAVPLALSHPEAELLHVMTDSDISMILSTEDHQELMKSIAAKTAAQFSLIPRVTSSHSQEAKDDLQVADMDVDRILLGIDNPAESPALIVYTSGTTGKPKGVVHTHNNITAQVQTLSKAWEYTPTDQFLHCLPLHHVHGLFNALLAPIYAGSTVEFLPKFSVRNVWQRWRESYPVNGAKPDDCITVFTGVPTMYTWLIQSYEAMDAEQKATSAAAAKQLRLMMSGSSALPRPVMQQWEAITGHRLLERYGMTEFVMSLSNPLRGERKPGTVGKPFPDVEARILSDGESGNAGEQGELCIRCPSLFKEYWRRPEATKEAFTEDGFFKTGDAVKVDEDGYYVILGRTSADIMKVGGYKLSALEIESVLLEHPLVQECCVLGLPDKDYGEIIAAIIVQKREEGELKPSISLEELRSWAQDKLAPYKLPTRLFLWDSIPRNAMGKVNKKELKKALTA